MTKKHDILPIDGGYVVVDEENEGSIGDICIAYYPSTLKLPAKIISDQNNESSPHWNVEYLKDRGEIFAWEKDATSKIIASIGKRIEGVPLIELPDEALRIANMALYGAFPNATKEEEKLYKEIYANGYRTASNIKRYTEADIMKAVQFGLNKKGCIHKDTINLYLHSLQKVPISVELEYELFGVQEGNFDPFRTAIEILKITNPETNTIIPIKVNY